MSRFKEFINEEVQMNKMIWRATALKGNKNGKKFIVFYKRPNDTYFRYEGHHGSKFNGITKADMTEEQVEREIKAFNVVADRYKIEDFR